MTDVISNVVPFGSSSDAADLTPAEIFKLPVLPEAEIFPMLPDDEMEDFVASIKEHGLLNPIVLAEVDGEIVLVDGKIRRLACEIAGVAPRTRMLPADTDLRAYLFSANIVRQRYTRSQLAMAGAMAEAMGDKPDIGVSEVSKTLHSQARTVLRHSAPLADQVVKGTVALNFALEEVERDRAEQAKLRLRMDCLKAQRPDLANAVHEEQMTLDRAEAKASADAEARRAATTQLIKAVGLLDHDPQEAAENNFDHAATEKKGITPERLRRVAEYLNALADVEEKRKTEL